MENDITEKEFTPEERAAVARIFKDSGCLFTEVLPGMLGPYIVREMRRAARDAANAAREDEAKKHRPPPDYGYNGEGGPGSGGCW